MLLQWREQPQLRSKPHKNPWHRPCQLASPPSPSPGNALTRRSQPENPLHHDTFTPHTSTAWQSLPVSRVTRQERRNREAHWTTTSKAVQVTQVSDKGEAQARRTDGLSSHLPSCLYFKLFSSGHRPVSLLPTSPLLVFHSVIFLFWGSCFPSERTPELYFHYRWNVMQMTFFALMHC